MVTGARQGIGRSVAEVLARAGARVFLVDVDPAVSEAASELRREGLTADSAQADVADLASVDAAFAAARQRVGSVSILVNVAGITTNFATVLQMDPLAWDREIRVNLYGQFHCIKCALPDMVAQRWGRIINISSGAATMGGYGQCSYAASKAGILGLTKTVALEHARDGITCNAVLPGLVETSTTARMRQDVVERIRRRIPCRELGKPDDVAHVVSFLASDEARYVNGAEVPVSGGIELFTF